MSSSQNCTILCMKVAYMYVFREVGSKYLTIPSRTKIGSVDTENIHFSVQHTETKQTKMSIEVHQGGRKNHD